VREFGKEKFELEMQNAMPLSQYIIAHLSEQNPLNSQEDKVNFLNEAEPILRKIVAPRFSLLLRKRVAEMAGVTDAEMQSLLKLPAPNKVPAKATQKQSRAPLSIEKRFVLMLMMQPNLARPEHLNFGLGFSEQDILLKAVVNAALQQPQSKPAALLHTIESQIELRLLRELQRELQLLDESLDFKLEFAGACTQLVEARQQKREGGMLDTLKEKPLSALTSEEREMLKSLTAKK
jgi:DNA primase